MNGKMKYLPVLALILTPLLPLGAVKEGDTLDGVVAEKGNPTSRAELGDTLLLNYPGETIKLREGKVISVKSVSPEPVAPPKPVVPLGEWTTSYRTALAQARDENRQVLLFFTGSDWCGWCKRLDAEVFSTAEFKAHAKKELILVKLDFPQQVPQSAQLKQQNAQLQKQYQIEGYPTIVVLDSRGKTIGQLGYQPGGPKAFISSLKGL